MICSAFVVGDTAKKKKTTTIHPTNCKTPNKLTELSEGETERSFQSLICCGNVGINERKTKQKTRKRRAR